MGAIRIVGGALRGRKIEVSGRAIRPTSDRTREAIFDILGPSAVTDATVLDLYAGTGALGIEALSRGARAARFVEGDRATARALRENLARLGLADRSAVIEADLDRGNLPAGAEGPFDLVFLDPPYASAAGALWIGRLAESGLIVYERRKGGVAPAPPPGWSVATERTYSDTTVTFYRKGGA